MPKRPVHYTEMRPEVINILLDLAQVDRWDSVTSNPSPKNDCFRFRQHIYMARRRILDVLFPENTPEANQALAWLTDRFGPRVNRQWLQLTRFDVALHSYHENRPLYVVKASVARVMYGPDIIFADHAAKHLAAARADIEQTGAKPMSSAEVEEQLQPKPELTIDEQLALLNKRKDLH